MTLADRQDIKSESNFTLVDTHVHLNLMAGATAQKPLNSIQLTNIEPIINEAAIQNVNQLICVGTTVSESNDCIVIAQKYPSVYATAGIHPNDSTDTWRQDCRIITQWAQKKESLKLVGIGECGVDRHYPGYNLQRQYDLFKTQIDIALEYDLALIVHSRDAYDETLKILELYKGQITRGIIHCFSYDLAFAHEAVNLGFHIGLGGTITYPKNETLRAVASTIALEHIVLETDAPFLTPQQFRGQKNHPKHIATIAHFLASLRTTNVIPVAQQTTMNAHHIFQLIS